MTGAEITLTFLGTGSAVPGNDRQQSSFVLRHQNGLVMFDCGEGTQYALRKYGISTRKEMVIWISHLHSDHFLGLPGLLSSFELLGRQEPITIVGPQGLAQTVQNLVIANYVRCTFELKVVELEPKQIFEGNGYTLHTIKARHQANALSVEWRENSFPGKVDIKKLESLDLEPGPYIGKLQDGETVEIEGQTVTPDMIIGPIRRGRSVVYSGDTAFNEDLAKSFQHIDVLVHEGTYPSDREELAAERQHTTIRQAARIAELMKPSILLITHISPRIRDFDQQIRQNREIFEPMQFTYQGFEYKIDYPYHDKMNI